MEEEGGARQGDQGLGEAGAQAATLSGGRQDDDRGGDLHGAHIYGIGGLLRQRLWVSILDSDSSRTVFSDLPMKVKFWGVRGSIPCPGVGTAKYGGNTSCIQVVGGQEIVILDAGTGIRDLGLQLMESKKPVRVHLLITHTHWDHIQGFPFFTPIYVPGNELFIYGPRALEKSLEEALMFQMQYSYFPVRGVELAAKVKFPELGEERLSICDNEGST